MHGYDEIREGGIEDDAFSNLRLCLAVPERMSPLNDPVQSASFLEEYFSNRPPPQCSRGAVGQVSSPQNAMPRREGVAKGSPFFGQVSIRLGEGRKISREEKRAENHSIGFQQMQKTGKSLRGTRKGRSVRAFTRGRSGASRISGHHVGPASSPWA